MLPKQDKVVVAGINTAKRHQRPARPDEQAGIIDKTCRSRLERDARAQGKPVRVGYRIEADGTKVRVARPSGEVIK